MKNKTARDIVAEHAEFFLILLGVCFCGMNVMATQYVVSGGAGDMSGGSWANARADVQAAVNAASLPGEAVWVSAGRYALSAPLSMRSNSMVLGGFVGTESEAEERDWDTNVTVLDGLGATQVVRMVSITNALLDGLVVTRGYVAATKGMGGGGILIHNATNCVVARCKILYNTSVRATGATSCEGGGMLLSNTLNCVVEDCLFTGNYVNPAGNSMSLLNSPGAIVNACRFVGEVQPTATGVIRVNQSGPKYFNCVASGNTVAYGGFLYGSQIQTAYNCTVCFTTNSTFGAFASYSSSIVLYNSLFAYNARVAVCEMVDAADLTTSNNLFHGQTEADFYDWDTTTYLTGAAAINSNTVPAKASGNVDGDPLFVRCPTQDEGTWSAVGAYNQDRAQTTLTDVNANFRPGALKGCFLNPDTAETLYRHAEIADNTANSITVWGKAEWAAAGTGYRIYDYHLRRNSPAINSGTVSGAPTVDRDGNPRPALGGIDIGAYEVQVLVGTMIMAY